MKDVDPENGINEECGFEGFLKLMRKKLNEPEMDEEMYEVFKTFDKDGKGYYEMEEMKEMMANYGEKLSDEEAKLLFKDFDLDGDGKIQFEDFIFMMMAK